MAIQEAREMCTTRRNSAKDGGAMTMCAVMAPAMFFSPIKYADRIALNASPRRGIIERMEASRMQHGGLRRNRYEQIAHRSWRISVGLDNGM